MTGPSTNFYVGPQQQHYTIPKNLLCYFSDYAKVCLESSFKESRENAVRLPDVDPDTFQWLLLWLYTGKIEIHSYYQHKQGLQWHEKLSQAWQVSCRVHMLGERLLFDDRLFWSGVQVQLLHVIQKAKYLETVMPLKPELVEEVLSGSAPIRYPNAVSRECHSLRPLMVEQLCTYKFCTTTDFMDWIECFELDGGFAAEIMVYMADVIGWAVKRWAGQTGRPVDVVQKALKDAEEKGYSQFIMMRPKTCDEVWLALRSIFTSAGCQAVDFRSYSHCFELDGELAAEILNVMARELLWVVEVWGMDKGEVVDVVAEQEKEERMKELEERIAQNISHIRQYIQRLMPRNWDGVDTGRGM